MTLQASKVLNNIYICPKNLEIISCLMLKQPVQSSCCIVGSIDCKVIAVTCVMVLEQNQS